MLPKIFHLIFFNILLLQCALAASDSSYEIQYEIKTLHAQNELNLLAIIHQKHELQVMMYVSESVLDTNKANNAETLKNKIHHKIKIPRVKTLPVKYYLYNPMGYKFEQPSSPFSLLSSRLFHEYFEKGEVIYMNKNLIHHSFVKLSADNSSQSLTCTKLSLYGPFVDLDVTQLGVKGGFTGSENMLVIARAGKQLLSLISFMKNPINVGASNSNEQSIYFSENSALYKSNDQLKDVTLIKDSYKIIEQFQLAESQCQLQSRQFSTITDAGLAWMGDIIRTPLGNLVTAP